MSKVAIISGSHRPSSQSGRVARYLKSRLEQTSPGVSTYLLDLGLHPLPFWDEEKWQDTAKWKNAWGEISSEISSTDSFIVVSPEWAGMVPPQLKNFFILCDGGELAHKPGLIVAVSSGRGGSYPVAELRMSSYKNNHLLWIPDHVIIREVEGMLLEASAGSDKAGSAKENDYLVKRIDYSLNLLQAYGTALKPLRGLPVAKQKEFPFGM